MKTVARIIAVFLGLLFIGSALFLLAMNYSLIPGLAFDLPAWAGETVLIAAGAVLLLLALIFLALGLRSSGIGRKTVLKGSEFGEVAISIAAIENMVLRIIQQTQGVKDVGRNVVRTSDGLVVKIRVKAMPDVSLPGLINDLQTKTKDHLEEVTGIAVHEVKVLVENIVMDQAVSKK